MTPTLLSAFWTYTLITALTPGPNNILALSAATSHGFRQSTRVLAGMSLGFLIVMLMCAGISFSLAAMDPAIIHWLSWAGAAYILWLAIHIAFSKPSTENAEQSASFLKGFMLQFVNVKIYMFGVTALTGYVVRYMSSFPALLFFELVIATIGTIATCTWTGLGVLIQKFYLRHFRVINIILALTLLECIWGMLR